MAKKKPVAEVQGADAEQEIQSTGPVLIELIKERPSFIDLIKFKPKEEHLKTIKDKRAEYDKVVIDGVADTANYKIVVGNMSQMRDDRRAFEDAAYDNVIDPLKAALKDYTADVDAVIAEFKAGEKAERDKKDFIDNEKKRLKKEAEEKKQKAALLRSSELTKRGAVFNGTNYTFAFDDGLMINTLQVLEFDDTEFNGFLKEVDDAQVVENERLAEEQRLQDEKEEEQKRQAEQVQQQATANSAALAELNERRNKLRIKEFKMLGGVLTGAGFHFPTIGYKGFVTEDSVAIMEDSTWDELIYDLENFTPAEEESITGYSQATGNPSFTGRTIADDFKEEDEDVAVATGEPVAEPFSFTNLGDTVEEPESLVTLVFGGEKTYEDIVISAKYTFRLFPDEYADIAINGCAIGKEGKVQGLNYAIVVKV